MKRRRPALKHPFTGLCTVLVVAMCPGCLGGSETSQGPGQHQLNSGGISFNVDTASGPTDTTTVQDVQSSSSSGAADISSGKSDAGCTLGATRCSKDGRERCGKQGWALAKCNLITPVCVDGKCLTCTPGATFCAATADNAPSNKVMQCDSTGASAKIVEQCNNGPCNGGTCQACKAGTHRCNDGKREVCAGGGLLWSPDHCPADKPVCLDGSCKLCPPSTKFCGKGPKGNEAVLACAAGGDASVPIEVCYPPKFCSNGACISCTSGQTTCKDGLLATCKADASGYELSSCPAKTPACTDGMCKLCKANTIFCQAATSTAPAAVMKCDNKGETAKATQTCQAGQVCHGNTCKSCASGSAVCLGNTPLICSADGSTVTVSQSCTENGLVCGDKGCSCNAGVPFCAAPAVGLKTGRSLWVCGVNGKTAKKSIDCPFGHVCKQGKCVACVAGTTRCAGNKALVCKANGSGWQVQQDCAVTSTTCVTGQCEDLCKLKTGNGSNLGCEFWAVDLDNATVPSAGGSFDAQNAPFAVLLTNPGLKTAAVTITFGPSATVPVAKTHKVSVAAKQVQTVVLPPSSWGLKPASLDGTSLQGMAFRIASTAAIAVFQHNPLKANVFSADASVLLPTNALGTTHRVLIRKQSVAGLRAYMAIVATRPGTTKVKIVSTAHTLAGSGIAALKPGVAQQLNVQQGHVLNIETAQIGDDLTGTLIESDQPVAVFSGAEAAHAPDTDICKAKPGGAKFCAGTTKSCAVDGDCPQTCCADHLEAQLPAVKMWGTAHIAGRTKARGNEQDTWRVVAAQNGTTVLVRPKVAAPQILDAGEWFEVSSDKDLVFEATKPVLVGQFMASSGLTGKKLGDPALIVLPPVSALGHEARFAVPSTYTSNWVSVCSPTGAQVKLDGKTQPKGSPIAHTGWSVWRIAVSAGGHTISSTDVVSAIVHGWSKDGSYGHSAGHGAQ